MMPFVLRCNIVILLGGMEHLLCECFFSSFDRRAAKLFPFTLSSLDSRVCVSKAIVLNLPKNRVLIVIIAKGCEFVGI